MRSCERRAVSRIDIADAAFGDTHQRRLVDAEDPRVKTEMHAAAEGSEAVLNAYQNAFAGFSDLEMLLLDGIWLEDPRERDQR